MGIDFHGTGYKIQLWKTYFKTIYNHRGVAVMQIKGKLWSFASPSSKQTLDLSASHTPIPPNIEQFIETIQSVLQSGDLRCIHMESASIAYFYLRTIIDMNRLHDEVVPKFKLFSADPNQWKLLFAEGEMRSRLEDVLSDLLKGHVVVTHQAWNGQAVSISLTHIVTRPVEQPTIEKVLLGAKESFVEDLDMNIGLLRRWIRDANLNVDYFTVGERSKTKVALVYYRDVTNPDWVKEITDNINKINIDRIIGHVDLMELIIGNNQTVFPKYELTEIPIRTSYYVNEGRVAILVEGSPFAALLPTVLMTMLQAAEYLTQGSYIILFVRFIRIVSLLLALLSPALYVALVSVNTAIIPATLGLAIAGDRVGIPYPAVVEALLLFVVMDIFLEATSFVPGAIGPALNIVGSLVIGQAAAQANLASRTIIIIAAITAVGTFLSMYQMTYALRIWKYPFILAAAMLGIYGIVCCVIVMAGHLCSLKSLGVPYLSPAAPLRIRDLLGELIWVRDISERKRRPGMWETIDKIRQKGDSDE
jgi:hypothetical protein